jgi:hypothetical protein
MAKPPLEPVAPRPVDMSPEAIDLRLRELAALRDLGLSLRRGRWLGPAGGDSPGRPTG